MKPLFLTLAALGAASALAACSPRTEASSEAAAPPAAAAAAPSDVTMAKSTGTVTAVGVDSITVDHAPIPEVDWPAMTMAFKASPDVAKAVKPGDKVAFDVTLQGGGGEITAIRKQ